MACRAVLVKGKKWKQQVLRNYRLYKSVRKKPCYPFPQIDDTLDALAGPRIFSTLDLKVTGYWQVGLSRFDLFERLMENVLRGLLLQICIMYLDDRIIVGKIFDDHLKSLEEIFRTLLD